MKTYLLPIFALLIGGWRKRTDFDKREGGLIINPLKKLIQFYQTMNEIGIKQMQEKINAGILLARKRLIEKTKKEDGELVVVRDGKVVRIKAKDLK